MNIPVNRYCQILLSLLLVLPGLAGCTRKDNDPDKPEPFPIEVGFTVKDAEGNNLLGEETALTVTFMKHTYDISGSGQPRLSVDYDTNHNPVAVVFGPLGATDRYDKEPLTLRLTDGTMAEVTIENLYYEENGVPVFQRHIWYEGTDYNGKGDIPIVKPVSNDKEEAE